MAYITSDNNYSTNKFIVSSTAGQGNYTTIASAIAAASSGDTIFIKPGTYTENITMVAGVNLSSDIVGATTPNVIINGTVTCNYTGACSCDGICFQTNSAAAINSASGTPVLELTDCSFACTSNTYCITASNTSFTLKAYNCTATSNLATRTLYSFGGISSALFSGCNFGNLGANVTEACLQYSNKASFENCVNSFPLKTNGTGYVIINNSSFDTSGANVNCLTVNNATTGVSQISNSTLSSGSASGIRIGAGTTTYTSYISYYNSATYDIQS